MGKRTETTATLRSGKQLARQARLRGPDALCGSINPTQASSPFRNAVPSPEPLARGRARNQVSNAEESEEPTRQPGPPARVPRGAKPRAGLFTTWTERPECLTKHLYLTALVGFFTEQ